MRKPISAALALAMLAAPLAIASPAFANSGPANPTAIKFADLNLDSADGKATLEARIRNAASRICATEQRTGTRINSRACMLDIREQVLAQVSAYQDRVGKGG